MDAPGDPHPPTPSAGVPDDLDAMQTPQYPGATDGVGAAGSSEEALESSPSLFTTFNPDSTWAGFLGRDGAAGEEARAAGPPYLVRRLVGTGGFGEVWEAVQTSLGRTVALKSMRGDLAETGAIAHDELWQIEAVFRQEALATAFLEHPNIVPVHDLGLDENNRPVLVMKLMRGQRWDELIREDFRQPVPEFLARHLPILVNVSQAAAFAHSRGILHRDIKPSQVMLGEFGEVVLMDWGIAMCYDVAMAAHHFAEAAFLSTIPTRANAQNPSGTPSFMAPEQTADSAEPLGPWTDIYQLGGSLYYLLTGTAPHRAENAVDSFFLAMKGEVEDPQKRAGRREVPPGLAAIVMKALAAEPADRFASAQDFIAAVEDYITGASRRRESQAIVREVEQRLAATVESYRDLNACNELVLRAGNLWPENPRVRPLREHVLLAFSHAALRNGDLTLARLMAESLDEGAERETMLQEVIVREREVRRERRRLRLLIIVSTLLFVVVVIDFILIFGWDSMARRASAERRLAEVQEQLDAKRATLELLEDFGPDRLPGLLARVDALRAREGDLSGRIARLVPMPSQLDAGGDEAARLAVARDEIAALFADVDDALAERSVLRSVFGESLADNPVLLEAARPTLALLEATTARDHARVRASFQAVAQRFPGEPTPVVGQALALWRSDQRVEARALLTREWQALHGEDPNGAGALALGEWVARVEAALAPAEPPAVSE
jgi:serine/threonine protein kinase